MAQICRFYGTGQCRFGQSCRFIHPGETTVASSSGYGGDTFGNTRQAGFGGGAQAKLGNSFNLPTEESIRTDLTERPTWFLSSYAPGKDPPAQLIDGKDISPEEARVIAYKLGAEGNSGTYEVEWTRLTSQADTQIRNILSDLPGAVDFMKNAYENRANSRYDSHNIELSAFSNLSSQPSPFRIREQSTSVFAQPQQASAFGLPQPISAFSQQSQPVSAFSQQSQPVSAFSQQSQPASTFGTTSPFTARASPAYGQSTFGQTPTTPAFGQPTFGSASVSQLQNTFGQPAFGQSPLAKPAFGQPTFGQPVFGQSASGQTVSAPAPFGSPNPSPAPTFGQSTSQQSTSAFSQPSPFGTPNVPKPAFGQPAFGQPPFAPSPPFGTNVSVPHTQSHLASAFGQPQQHLPATSVAFGNPISQNTTITPNVFQQNAQDTTVQNTTSAFSNSNPFQQGQQAASNQFQQNAQAHPSQPISSFAQHPAPISTFGIQQQASPFSNQNPFQSFQQQRLVGHQVNLQLQEQQKAKKWDDPVIEYIQMEKEAFAALTFSLGNVPTVAPSRDMCWG